MDLITALQMNGRTLNEAKAIIVDMKERMKNGEQAYEVLDA